MISRLVCGDTEQLVPWLTVWAGSMFLYCTPSEVDTLFVIVTGFVPRS